MKIQAFKLITGEELVSEIESESESEFVLINPVGIAIVRGQNGQPNVGFSPFPIHAEQQKDQTISIAKKHVVYYYTPAQDFINNYNSIFGSGIILPQAKEIITG